MYINKTTNGGLNWGYQRDTSGSYRMSFINDFSGWTGYYGTGKVSHTTNGGGEIIYMGFVQSENSIPKEFKLYQNFPNPFNPTTSIKLDLSKDSKVNLLICDNLGRELYTIINEHLKAGSYTFTWDAWNYSSGVYFYRLITDGFTQTKKMLLIK